MASLALLPPSTVHRIASSQVITSVSTAIKELVENSLDAGADSIEVKLEDYGFSKIEIRDNGCGVNPADVTYMAQRHYTSKINTFENLNQLTTYGFRGEALCSLCAVGNVVVTTKTKHNLVAQCFTLGQTGEILSTKPSPTPTGTTVVVNNLFKNLPVRKQFLTSSKKCKEELKKVEELVMAFGCVHPGLRVVLRHNKSLVWQKSKVSDHKTALLSVFGLCVMTHLEKVDYKDDNRLEILGYLPKPDADPNLTCRPNNDRGFVFINDRPVVMREISKLVRQYYCQGSQKFPVMFLKLKLPTDEVDVNLEPNKTHVLLSEKEHILETIKTLLSKLYGQQNTDNHEVVEDSEHCNRLSSGDTLPNLEMCNPIASSTLNSLEYDDLPDESQTETNIQKVGAFESGNESDLGKARINIFLSKRDSNCANLCTIIATDNSAQKRNLTSEMLGAESMLVNGSNEGMRKGNPTENHPGSNNLSRLTGTQSSITSYASQDKVLNITAKQQVHASTPECTGNMDDLDLRLTENSNSNITKGSSELTKEDMDNINQLLDLTEDCQQGDNKKESQQTHSSNIHNNSKTQKHIDFDDILDDDFELDQILKDLEKKKTQSQSKQSSLKNSQVVQEKENVICEEVLEKTWSTGSLLKDKQENTIEPVQLLPPPPSIKHKTPPVLGKRKHSNDKDKKKLPNKKITRIPQALNQSLITFHASQSPWERLKGAEKVHVSFSMLNLKEFCKDDMGISQSSAVCKRHLIGWLEPSGVWLVRQGTDILYANHCRIQEQILYHRLIQTHVLPREELQRSIALIPSVVGGEECWDILTHLQCECLDAKRVIIDERIRSNGFDIKIKIDPDTNEQRVDVYGIFTSLPFYGTPDLMEILGLIKAKGVDTCSLADCRPLKVVNYFKSEAVRICRAQSPRITRHDMEAILVKMEELPMGIHSCLHGYPFFGKITDISSYL